MITIPQMGKHDEAWMVLKHIHDTNMRARGEPERVFTVSTPRALLFIIPAAAKPLADDWSVSPPAGEQDKNPQTAGWAGRDAEWVSQPCTQGPLQDQGWTQRSRRLFMSCLLTFTFVAAFSFIVNIYGCYE